MFFSLTSFLPTDLSSRPTLSNSQICFGRYTVVEGVPYGIVISTTYQTHPIIPLTLAYLTSNFTSPDIAQNVTAELIKLHPTLSDAGWGGYITSTNSSCSITLGAPNISWVDTNATFLPFVQYVTEATGGMTFATTRPFASFYEFYQTYFTNPIAQGVPRIELASRFLPRSLAVSDPAKVAKILLSLDGASMK